MKTELIIAALLALSASPLLAQDEAVKDFAPQLELEISAPWEQLHDGASILEIGFDGNDQAKTLPGLPATAREG